MGIGSVYHIEMMGIAKGWLVGDVHRVYTNNNTLCIDLKIPFYMDMHDTEIQHRVSYQHVFIFGELQKKVRTLNVGDKIFVAGHHVSSELKTHHESFIGDEIEIITKLSEQ